MNNTGFRGGSVRCHTSGIRSFVTAPHLAMLARAD